MEVMLQGKRPIAHFSIILIAAVLFSSAQAMDRMQTQQETTACTGGDLHAFRDARLSEKLYGMPGIENVGRITPCLYRGNQPSGEAYQTLKAAGVKTVINLRAAHGEREKVENAGMKYLEFPLAMTKGIRKEILQEVIRAMSDPSNQPVYLHCALGQDRTGVVVAAYRMEVDGWSYEHAVKEMQSFGFNDAWLHLKKSLKAYARQKGKVR